MLKLLLLIILFYLVYKIYRAWKVLKQILIKINFRQSEKMKQNQQKSSGDKYDMFIDPKNISDVPFEEIRDSAENTK